MASGQVGTALKKVRKADRTAMDPKKALRVDQMVQVQRIRQPENKKEKRNQACAGGKIFPPRPL